ncbi:MAG: glycoside hydrolase family 97 catalytic domain-containing protein [Paludibacter sp.]|nr:glycoside hydrolase family 97 catalytic domain-containing protein [Paludibacter sp.]
MRKFLVTTLAVILVVVSLQAANSKIIVKSPDGKLILKSWIDAEGTLMYEVKKDKKIVILPSSMGLSGDVDFTQGLTLKEISKPVIIKDTYSAPAEKRAERSYKARYIKADFINAAKQKLTVEYKATNEGVALRYLILSDSAVAIKNEITHFQFDVSTKAWLHPHADAETGWCETQPSYEEQYLYDIPVGTKAPKKAGWSFPALFKTTDNWVLLTEAGLTPDYVGTRLAQNCDKGIYSIAFPQKGETVKDSDPNYVVSKHPTSPWRVIVVGSLATIVQSQMVSDLAAPADKAIDYSWVKTGISSWSWGVLHDNATVYPIQKQFIDYASDMHWDYCLIDADWDRKIGYEKIKELADYAKTKNIKLLLWYNSSGEWNSTQYTPKGALVEREARRAEFKRTHDMGIAGVKVDFWPGDGQSSIQLYYDMMQDAADFHLLINFHGTTVPRGWSRTFPNLVTMEAIRGFEFTTFDQKDTDMAPKHLTMIPYARNAVGPMDFTPVCFGEIQGKKRRTSNAFELALTVVLQSGIQHYVEIPESMAKQPDFVQNYMRNVPCKWDDVRLLDGFPGKYVVIARRSGDKWYVAGINSQAESQKISLDLSKLKKLQQKQFTIITDGSTNRSFEEKPISLQGKNIETELKPNGGFVMIF